MKILVISNIYEPQIIGGYEVIAEQAANCLANQGHVVTVLTSLNKSKPFEELKSNNHEILRVLEIPLGYYSRAFENSYYSNIVAKLWNENNAIRMMQIIRDRSPDLIYIFNPDGLGIYSVLLPAVWSGVPVIWELADSIPVNGQIAEPNLNEYFIEVLNSFENFNVRVCSENLASELEKSDIAFNSTFIRKLWIEPNLEFKRENFWNPNTSKFLNVCVAGQLAPHKGVDLVIDSLLSLPQEMKNRINLTLIGGDTPFVQGYMRSFQRENLASNIRHTGLLARKEIFREFSKQDLLIFPTWAREPFGLTPLEAGTQGCISLVTAGIGVTEYLPDSQSLIQIHPSRSEIAAKVASIFLGKTDVYERATNGIKDFPTLFRIEDSMVDLIAIALKTKRIEAVKHQENLISHFTDITLGANQILTKQKQKLLDRRKWNILRKILRVFKLRVLKRLREMYYAEK
jgi:glycosyltransferase involved in cell wall biosynthesis